MNKSNEPAPKAVDRVSWLWLVLAGLLCIVSNGRWISPLATWLAPLFLLRFLRTQRPLRGLVAGIVMYSIASLIMWLHMIMTRGFAPYSVGLVLGLGFLMYTPFIVDRLIAPRLSGITATLVFPVAWVGMEYCMASVSPYATFGLLANSQFSDPLMTQLVSVTGSWGVAFMITWLASAINAVWEESFEWRRIRTVATVYSVAVTMVLLGGGLRMTLCPPDSRTVTIASVGSSDDIGKRMHEAETLADYQQVYADETESYLEWSRRAARSGAEIVFWQEYSIRFVDDEEAFYAPGRLLAREEGIYLGMAYSTLARNEAGEPATPGEKAYPPDNKFVLIDPSGVVVIDYVKSHPIPGEGCAVGDGTIQFVDTPYGRIGAVICFDMEFPGLIRQAARNKADIMLAPSYDWKEIDPINTYVTAIRGVENGFSVVRAVRNGLSMAVDYQGRVLASLDDFTTEQRLMFAEVPTEGVTTIYGRFGDWFAWLCCLGLIAMIVTAVRPKP